MQMRTVKASAKGQFTIPKDLFDSIGREQELVIIEESGRLVILPSSSAAKRVIDDLEGWEHLGLSAFADVWDNEEDEVWNDL